MRVIALGVAAMLAGWAMPAAAQGKEQPIRAFEGRCSSDSRVAGNPYPCDLLVQARIDPKGPNLMLMFAKKGDDAVPMIGIGGKLDGSGSLIVDGVQFRAGDRIPFDGSCAFTRSGRKITAVRCTATEKGGEGRTILIDFPVTTELKTS